MLEGGAGRRGAALAGEGGWAREGGWAPVLGLGVGGVGGALGARGGGGGAALAPEAGGEERRSRSGRSVPAEARCAWKESEERSRCLATRPARWGAWAVARWASGHWSEGVKRWAAREARRWARSTSTGSVSAAVRRSGSSRCAWTLPHWAAVEPRWALRCARRTVTGRRGAGGGSARRRLRVAGRRRRLAGRRAGWRRCGARRCLRRARARVVRRRRDAVRSVRRRAGRLVRPIGGARAGLRPRPLLGRRRRNRGCGRCRLGARGLQRGAAACLLLFARSTEPARRGRRLIEYLDLLHLELGGGWLEHLEVAHRELGRLVAPFARAAAPLVALVLVGHGISLRRCRWDQPSAIGRAVRGLPSVLDACTKARDSRGQKEGPETPTGSRLSTRPRLGWS